MISLAQIKQIYPNNKQPELLVTALNNVLPKYEINTVNRLAGYMAQVGHESLGFTALVENLNYSAVGLRKIFPKYFLNDAIALQYARQPMKIANRIYATRMGNGNEASGDGWKFRGHGPLQLTGHDNITLFATSIGKTLDETIVYIATLEGGIESACWYWKTNNINAACDEDNIDAMSDLINRGRRTAPIGDSIGYADRLARYTSTKKILGA